MLRSYLTIAFRNLFRRKGYSLLNIAGLAIGITCCLLIFQYVSFEKSYEHFNPQSPQVVRLRLDSYRQGQLQWKSATSYPGIGPNLKKEYPEVTDFCRLIDAEMLFSNDEKNIHFTEKKGYFADPSSVEMLAVKVVQGNSSRALDAPDKMIISETMARKYFGNENAVGKKLSAKGYRFPQLYEITGVFKDYPRNSHLLIDYLVSYSTLGKINRQDGDSSNATETSFGWYDFYTYLKLKPGTNPKQFESKLVAFCDAHINKNEWNKKNNVRNELHVLPVTDIHLYSNYNQEAEVNGDGQTVSFLFLIGVLIIFIAWINYINLATARSIERAREVGVRKVLGAVRTDLVGQFLTESLVLNVIALLIAIIAAFLLTPAFNQFTGRDFSPGFRLPLSYWSGFLLLFFAGSFLAGIYPAFVLSGYKPVKVLKGIFKNSTSGIVLRKVLIIAQFITSVVLVAGTMIVYQQLSYMRSQKLGTNISQTLVIEGTSAMQDSVYKGVFQPFKADILHQGNVRSVTASSSVMGKEIYWTSGIKRLGSDYKSVTLYHLGIDYDFIPSFEMKMAAGRNFSPQILTDNKAVLLNEEAVRTLGFKSAQEAVNQKVVRRDTLTIAGVVADYHHQGLQKKVDPMIFLLRPNSRTFYSVKLGTGDIRSTVAGIQGIWKRYFPEDPFNYYFLDDSFNQQYRSDQLFGSIFSVFALLAILIACFGLAGLSAYNILQRRKEIGIRKVMGASVRQLLILLSKDFLRLVFISFLVAIPVTIVLMNRWLQDYAYRIRINWWVFAVAGGVSLCIAFITISFQSVKAALANPVKSLRTE
ncbi:MAG: ABC transporter permease [Chitinophagaceae bacterium]|nr:ABC transporter permease [Chitinophagaceae bacterium]